MHKGWLKFMEHLEEGICFLFLTVMCCFVFLQLFFRFILNNPLLFTEEISRFSYVWITFIGLSLATKTSDHIRVDFFIGLLPERPRRAVNTLVNLACLALLLYMAYFGIRFMIFSRMNISSALELPLNLVYVSFPIGCLLASFRLARIVWKGGRP